MSEREVPTPKRTGRPRLLSTEQVLDAAIEIGLEGLTMATLARRLNVSPGMLYGYVTNRDELIRLAASRVGEDYGYPEDRGQHWAVYAAENATAWFSFFTGPGEFLLRYMTGRSGPAAEIDRTNAWLSTMRNRGFGVNEALLLQRQLGEIVMGGAVTEIHNRALHDRDDRLSSALAARGVESGDQMRAYVTAGSTQVWQKSLTSLLQATALERSESFDGVAVGRALSTSIAGGLAEQLSDMTGPRARGSRSV